VIANACVRNYNFLAFRLKNTFCQKLKATVENKKKQIIINIISLSLLKAKEIFGDETSEK